MATIIREIIKDIQLPKVKVGTVPYVEIGDIDIHTKKILFKQKATIQGAKLCPKGSVIVSRVRPNRGAVALIDENTAISSAFTVLTAMESKCFPKYLFYYLAWNNNFFSFLQSRATGATYPTVKEEVILSYPISLPDLAEQKRIVDILDEAESLKKKRAEADQKMNELIPALFVQMFGDLKKYPTKPLSDFCKITTGNTPPRAKTEFYGSEIEWIKTDNFFEGLTYPTLAKEGLSNAGIKVARIVDENSILMACIAGSIKSIGNVCLTNRRVAFNQQINALTITDNTDPLFLYWFLRAHKSKTQKLASHVLKFIINKTRLEGLEVSIPPINLQNQFAEKVKEIEAQKEKQNQSAIQLDGLFSSLLAKNYGS